MNIYSKIALGALCASLVLVSAFAITNVRSPGAPSPNPTVPKADASPESRAPEGASDHSQSEEYYLALEGSMLCAYKIKDGQKELIRSRDAKPMLMNESEMHTLERGIYAESFEDLCLYFESYLS